MKMSRERLERLLRVRRAGEAVERGRLARSQVELQKRTVDAEAVAERRVEAFEDMRSRLTGGLDLARLKAASEGKDALDLILRRAEAGVRDAGRDTEDRRRAVEGAHLGVRAFEKLADRSAEVERTRRGAAEARERDDRRREHHQP